MSATSVCCTRRTACYGATKGDVESDVVGLGGRNAFVLDAWNGPVKRNPPGRLEGRPGKGGESQNAD